MNPCFSSAEILLPDFESVSPERWAVVACDQFTSEPEYWERVEQIVGQAPSTLRMILPEVYLNETEQRIPQIHSAMKEYISSVLQSHPNSMIYTERTQADGSIRRGVVLAIDLECYDYRKGASSLIRATEATVIERIPPRVAIRRGASLELPHVMLLIDDPDHTVIEPLTTQKSERIAYDTDLMLNGGHLRGRFLSAEEMTQLSLALEALTAPEQMSTRYGDALLAPLLFAVGDGNHSLASAKAAYEEIKTTIGAERAACHPARYALAEIVNIHDEALCFEPIYRVVFGTEPEELLQELQAYIKCQNGTAAPQSMLMLWKNGQHKLSIPSPVRQLTVGTLQDFLDSYCQAHPQVQIDYIHGEDSLKHLCERENTVGFLFDGMKKSDLFRTVVFDGALPRKTFSMGHAEEKRYYMECRRITHA